MNPSPKELFIYLNKHYPGGSFYIVYEAGFCGFWPQREFTKIGIKCIVVNPADIPSSNKEKVIKTDPTDSRKLARELENNSLKLIYISDVYAEQLRSLMRLRFQLVQNHTRIKNRIKMLLYCYGIIIPQKHLSNPRWSGLFIDWLHSVKLSRNAGQFTLENLLLQLHQCRENLNVVLRQLKTEAKSKSIEPIITLLISVPGIAFITAMSLYTEIINIKRFSNFDHLASYVGLVPSLYSSGETEYSRGLSFRHNKFLRPLIIEAAWTAIRRDPVMTQIYYKLIHRMPKQKAIIKIAKKLLRRIRYVWIQQEQYKFAFVA